MTSASAIARELARFDLRIALIEAGADVGAGTSKANTAILHTGFDAKPGSLEARLVARGHDLLLAYAEEVGIPLERTGALLVAWDAEQLARFGAITENAERCGYEKVREVGRRRAVSSASRTSAPERSARSRSPTSTSSAPSPRRSRSRPRPSSPASTCGGPSRWWGSSGWTDGGWRAGDTAGSRHGGLGRQRRRAALGRGPPDGGPRRVHGHAPARRADRLRQAEPPAREPRPAAGAHRDDQGRPRRADGVRQRDARADRGRHRAQGRHELDGGRARPPAVARPTASCPDLAGQEVDRGVRGPARRHRALRLPDGGRRRPAVRVGRRNPLDRAHRLDGDRRARPRRARPRRAGAPREPATGLPELRMPNIGEACAASLRPAGAHRRGPRLRARSSASASASRGARSATPPRARSRPPTSTGCAAGPAC